MLRFAHLVAAVQAEYAGPEPWYTSAEDAARLAGALSRIVVYPLSATVGPPRIGPQGRDLEELEPGAEHLPGAVDDVVWERVLRVRFELWAPTTSLAESRVHALLLALDRAVSSTLEIDQITETWHRQQQRDIAGGGQRVDLELLATLYVVTSDRDVVLEDDPAPIGAGQPTSPVDALTMRAHLRVGDTDSTVTLTEELGGSSEET